MLYARLGGQRFEAPPLSSTAPISNSSTTQSLLSRLKEIRVIQRNLCYVLGLPPSIARKEVSVNWETAAKSNLFTSILGFSSARVFRSLWDNI